MVSPFAPRTFALLLSVSLGLSGHARAFALRQSGLEESPHVREELVEALSSGGILPEDKRLLRRGVSIGQVARFLLVERPWATVVFLPDLGAEKWGFRRVALGSKKRRFSSIREIQRLLWRYESYALHEGGRTEIWVVPQAVLLQESPRERVKEFRSLAQQALRGDQREDGTRRWIALFGGEGGKGLDLRVSPRTGQVYLFGLQLRNRRYRSVNVYFPRRFRNQVVRFVPHVDEQGRLFVRVYRLEPLRFLRDLRWDEDSQWIASITPVRQVLAHEAPGAPNAAGSSQAVEDRDYSVEELQQATGIEPEALRDQGCLYLNAEGRVPAGLVAMITRTAKEINRQEYPVGALPQLLGRDYGTVWERVKQKVAPSEVGQAGRFLTLPREIVLEWVLLPRIREWIGQEVGGLVSRHDAARELGVPAAALQKLKGRAPYLDGVPLWVQFGPKRPFTRGGLDAVHREIRKVLSEVHARGEVVLLHAVRSRYPRVTRTRRSVLLRKAVQAVVELGIPYRELGHPLSEAERWIAVPRARLGELFHEVERKTRRTLRFIHSDRRYSVLAVAEVLRISSQAVFQKIKKNQLKAEPGLEIGKQRIWISGEELLRLVRREQFSKAGLEELAGEANQAIKVALTIVPFRDTALFLTRTGEAFRAVRKIPQGDWAGLSGDFRSLQQQLRAVRVMKDSGQKPAAAELWRALHTFQKRWEAAFELGNTQPVQEASKELFEQFRALLHQSVAGSPQAREELLRRWGTSGDQGEGVVVRIPRGRGKLYLFGFLRSKGDYTTVLLSFPPRLHARLIRMIPRIEKSRLFLYLHEVEPARLFRSLLWHPDSASFRRIGSLRAEKLRLIAQIPMPANGPRIIESESYPRDSLSRLTGIPEGLLAELEVGGVLYRDPSGGVPGGLAAALALAYRQTDREEYPISALQDLLGKKKREAQRFPARKGFPVIQRAGQERRLSRGIVVKLVLERQAWNWIREHVDGFVVVEGEPERALGLPAVVLWEWPDPPPVYVGYPLWVKLNHRRLWTRKGFQGLMEEVNAVSERLSREGKVILLDAVKGKYPGGVGGDLARRYLAAVRAMRELGIDHQVLADHPLAALRTVIAVDGGRLKELFREAEHPTRWKADQIRLDRSYGVPAVARVLGWAQSRLHQRILYRKAKVQSEQFFGRHFIPGAEVRRLLWNQAGLEEDLGRREFLQRAAGGTVSGLIDWSQFLKEELGRVFTPEQLTLDRQKMGETVVGVLDLAMYGKHYKLRDFLRNPSGRLVEEERLARLRWVMGQGESFSPDPMLFPGFSASGFLGPFREYARRMDGWVRSAERQDPREAIPAEAEFVGGTYSPLRSLWRMPRPEELSRQEGLAGLLLRLSRWMQRASQTVLDLQIKEKAAARAIRWQERTAARYREMAAWMQQLAELPPEEQNKFLLAGVRTKRRQFGEMLRRAEPLARHWAGRLQGYWRQGLQREWGRAGRAVQEYPEFARSVQPRVGSGAVFVGLFPDPDDLVGKMKQMDDWALLVKLQKERQWEVRLVREELREFSDPIGRAAQIASEMAESGFEGQVGIVLGVLSHEQAVDLMNLERIYEELHSAHPSFTASFIFTFEEALQRARHQGRQPFPSWSGCFAAWASDPVPGIMHVLPGLVLPTELREWFERQMRIEGEVGQAA